MSKNYINALWILCLLFCSITTSQAIGPKETKEKTVKASYKVKANELLELDNKYGNVQIENHRGSSIEVEVKIKAWDGTATKAQETLDRISIQQEQNGHKVTLETVIDHKNPNHIDLNSSRGFHINYRIKMPENMNLELENHFGNVQLANVLGEVDVEVKHGNFQAATLGMGKLEVKFGNAAVQRFQKRASVEIKHGNLQIDKATRLELEQAHGNLQLGTVEKLEGELEHGNVEIKQIAKAINWESKFGNVSLGAIKANFTNVKVEVKHGNASMAIDKGANFDLVAKTEHGRINHTMPNMNVSKTHTTEAIKGSVNGGSNASVAIAVEFGNISLR